MDLLFVMAHWHSLAKLRVQTDSSLRLLDLATVTLGSSLRHFKADICPHFATRETSSEVAARGRADARRAARNVVGGAPTSTILIGGRRPRTFNLTRIKLHALGDYVPNIKRIGTTDSSSTQTVSFAVM